MNAESYRVLRFRCAKTGRRFIVGFARKTIYEKYKVVRVVGEQDFTPDDRQSAQLDGPVYQLELLVNNLIAAIPKIFRGEVSLKDSLLPAPPNKTQLKADNSHNSQGQQKPPHADQTQQNYNGSVSGSFDIKEFDFAGWYCPCCGFAKGFNVPTQFIRCGKCGQYICGGGIRQGANGQRTFTCSCGNRGVLSGGSLSSLAGMGINTQKPSELPKPSAQLQQPKQNLPAVQPTRKKKD